ncbi:hypothetical protein B0A55_06272 [Friedmanniomyces simplex]|uniref:Zn(2)-C6 fungal-type domain-containing protein n=1 Tax=Friedmanniomyces simplex TaxID=329884 RepID=A0A4U0XRP9_9PEZI|nr:hypothetical protein B0A55_06272 [Friedmanniomyces simplex]
MDEMDTATDWEEAMIAGDAHVEHFLPASGDKSLALNNYACAKEHLLAAPRPHSDEEGLDKLPLADDVEKQFDRGFHAISEAWHPRHGACQTVDDTTIVVHQYVTGRREQKNMQEHRSSQMADDSSEPKQPVITLQCFTCQQRKVTCDESKPECIRCQQAGQRRQGYDEGHTCFRGKKRWDMAKPARWICSKDGCYSEGCGAQNFPDGDVTDISCFRSSQEFMEAQESMIYPFCNHGDRCHRDECRPRPTGLPASRDYDVQLTLLEQHKRKQTAQQTQSSLNEEWRQSEIAQNAALNEATTTLGDSRPDSTTTRKQQNSV